MAIKKYKPTSPGRRFLITSDYSEVTKTEPEKSLTRSLKRAGGRNNTGRTTAHWRGGGTKRTYRVIDFKRNKDGVPAKVAAIEYDPNRTCRIALLHYKDGEKSYILAPADLGVGDTVVSGSDADIRVGNCLPLANIPLGTRVHNIEIQPGRGGQIARAAGMAAQIMAKEAGMITLRLPSGEMRMVHGNCRATVGEIGNQQHENERLGKAGKMRAKGRKPHVRGVAMSPRDHPHGGGEAKSPVGRKKGPVDRWGNKALGSKTRRNKRTDAYIVRRRKA
ncbi:50S ribosomal protein L2 [Fimbriimonadia bacterium ATM]|nr:MAG: 50S ribosomal protein L2 [Armatimonadota bacterium]MBC6968647.1 50S ribosomal protein L2 [Armatimonadota bacterium]MCE7898514.1 50S ribosomal protein L2 [Armatimonadetes bacterium ATM1]MDL1928193.1 50S ribosomal protein L2 [Fimbriimonadia bacterium ATM]RIJ98246.1 MAG: 50S ribosomal protein L2 [Armatimonadota bacterium]